MLTKVLPNKVVVNTVRVDSAHSVAIGFWFGVGSRDEGEVVAGLSHFVEHMLFEGTTTRSSHDISYSFDAMGGYVNAFTDKECVCMYCTVPYSHLGDALELLCDMASNASFPPKETLKESLVIQNEIASDTDDPEESALETLSNVLWKDKDLSRPIAGTIEDVKRITRDMLVDWYARHFACGSLWVCIAGNLTAYSEEDCYSRLGLLAERRPPLLRLPPKGESAWQGGVHIVETKFSQHQVFFCARIRDYNPTREFFYRADVFNAIMGDTMSSRLFQKLREEKGLCYNVYSIFNYYKDAAYWCAYASTEKHNLSGLVDAMLEVVYSLNDSDINTRELDCALDCAKEHIIGEDVMGEDSMEYRMKRMDQDFYFSLPPLTIEENAQGIRSITKDDIRQFARSLLGGQKCLLITGPRISHSEHDKIIALGDKIGI